MRTFLVASVACSLALASAALPAQGTLSSQGFGYPAGELSSRAAATGGGLTQFDPLSTVNPATLGGWVRGGLYLQYAPEWRRIDAPGGRDRTTVSRFPLAAIALGLTPRWTAALSATSLLDRTWQTRRTGYVPVPPGDSAQFTETFSSSGAINDLRLALSFVPQRRFSIGVGGHVLTGENRLRADRFFSDSEFASFTQRSAIGYSGSAVSGGFVWRPVKGLALAASGRLGGTIRAYSSDTVLSRAKVPKQAGAGAEFTGIAGVLLAASARWIGWSSLGALSNGDAPAMDGWDVGGGAEMRGPYLLGGDVPLRVGFRRRTMPFLANGHEVKETSIALGLGYPIAGGRSRIDLTLLRASRSASLEVREHAWTVSTGITVRP